MRAEGASEGRSEGRVSGFRRHHMTDSALRYGKFKWIENRNLKETTLYNLEKDIGVQSRSLVPLLVPLSWFRLMRRRDRRGGWAFDSERRGRRDEPGS